MIFTQLQTLLRRFHALKPSTCRSRRFRTRAVTPEVLESRQLLSVTPVLVADLNTSGDAGLSASDDQLFGAVNGATVFIDYQSNGASRLRITTSDPFTSEILQEFTQRTSLTDTSFTERLGVLYFHAVDSLTGDELWRTDGTSAGTQRVWSLERQPRPGEVDSALTAFEKMRILKVDVNTLYFNVTGFDSTSSRTLWKSDGTSSGTRPIDGIVGMKIDYSTITIFGDSIVYAADDFNGAGMEPWRTKNDGTTEMIGDIRPGQQGSWPHAFSSVSNVLWFVANDGVHGAEPWYVFQWRPTLFMDINPGADGSFPQGLAISDDELYFTADDGVHGRELWWYFLGPEAFLVSDLNPGSASSNITSGAFTSTQNEDGEQLFLFSGDNGNSNQVLWATQSGHKPEQLTAASALGGIAPEFLTGVGDKVYFKAFDGFAGRELWVSDGTKAGTENVSDLAYGGYDSSPRSLQPLNGRLYFVADEIQNLRTNVYSLVHGRPQPLAQYFSGTQSSTPGRFFEMSGQQAFSTTAQGLWYTNGETNGTQQLRDDFESVYHFIGSNSTNAFFQFSEAGQNYVFAADGLSNDSYLTEGVALGFQRMGALAVFLVKSSDGTLTLWTSDGTAAGSHAILNVSDRNPTLQFVASAESDGVYYFTTQDELSVFTLWKTDGTASGTISVDGQEIAPNLASDEKLFAANGIAYFSASVYGLGSELWQSDGTADGTTPIRRTATGAAFVTTGDAVEFRGGLIFSGNAAASGGNAVWFTDGNPEGTIRLTDDLSDSAAPDPAGNLFVVGDVVYFTKTTDGSGTELWKTDGTLSGTAEVVDLLPGPLSSFPQSLSNIDGQLMFTALDASGVRQIWITDGTVEGTIVLTAAESGVAVHPQTDFALTPGGIVFTGATPQTGWELYRISTALPQAPEIGLAQQTGTGVIVAWHDVVDAVRYEVWINSLNDPSLRPVRVLTTHPEWNVPAEFQDGAYRVWVRSLSILQQPSSWSVPQDLVVGMIPVMHSISPRSLERRPQISWTGPQNAASYEFWLTNRDTKTRLEYETGLTSTSFRLADDLTPARYAVWVRATHTDGTLSAWSALTEFDVLAPPVVLTSGAGEILDSQASLVWNAVPGVTGYDVRIIPIGPSALPHHVYKVSGTSLRTTGLQGGQYKIFVQAVRGGRPFSAWGSGDVLFLKPAPAGLRRTGTIIAGNTGIAWNSVPLASSYTLEIVDTTTGRQVLPREILTTGTAIKPVTPFRAGQYAFRVRANYPVGQSSDWTPPLTFELFHEAVPITSSQAATADATPVITWAASTGATSYEILASRIGSSVAPYRKSGISGTSHRIATPLSPGVNDIWVRAHFADGSRSAWGSASQLVVGPAPLITRTGTGFTWTPVNAATHYELWTNYLGPDSSIRQIVYVPVVLTTGFTLPATLPKGRYQMWLRAIRAESGALYAGAWGTSGAFEIE